MQLIIKLNDIRLSANIATVAKNSLMASLKIQLNL